MALPVLTAAQSKAWDAMATSRGRSVDLLMESAGRAVAQLTLERFGAAAARGVLVACGAGNNGGDGWVAARALASVGAPVWIAETGVPPEGPALAARTRALEDGARLVPVDGPWPGVGLAIDAILGSGARGAPRDDVMRLLHRLVDLHLPIVAVDGPTGLDLDTGVQHGPLVASLTVTFGGVKRGHLLARDEIGDFVVAGIGLPAPDRGWPALIDRHWAAERVAPFAASSYKGTRGHVVIVGGAPGMNGAARLAARAAFGAGAGLLHVVAPAASIAILQHAEPDVQTRVHEFAAPLSDDLRQLLGKADAVAIGPGLGREAERTDFIVAVLDASPACVVDADALTMLKTRRDDLERIARSKPVICTPHLGEFSTLFPEFAHDLETAPWDAAIHAAHASGAVVLLKGVPTVVAAADGTTLTVAAGNPGLASGGSGDVLTGITATMLAQHLPALEAAAVAAQVHGDAADFAARRVTARAMRPMDVVTALGDVWRSWSRPVSTPRFPVLGEWPRPEEV